jgi:hypothetical protein
MGLSCSVRERAQSGPGAACVLICSCPIPSFRPLCPHSFNQLLKLQRLQEAWRCALALKATDAWRQLGAAALEALDTSLAVAAYRRVCARRPAAPSGHAPPCKLPVARCAPTPLPNLPARPAHPPPLASPSAAGRREHGPVYRGALRHRGPRLAERPRAAAPRPQPRRRAGVLPPLLPPRRGARDAPGPAPLAAGARARAAARARGGARDRAAARGGAGDGGGLRRCQGALPGGAGRGWGWGGGASGGG